MNLRSRGRKVTALVVVLLLGLAVLGVAYAQWSAMLTINGTIGTGNVSGEVKPPPDSYTNDPADTIDPGYDKHVGVCTIAVVDPLTAEITIDNAYPSYSCMATAKIHNNGSIPAKVASFECTGADPEITCTAVDGVGSVVPVSKLTAVEVDIHVEDAAAPNTTYTCTCTMVLVPWNDP